MENLALNCTITQLITIIEEEQNLSGQNIIPKAQQLLKLPETDYNHYTELDKLKFLITDNKPIDLALFKTIVAKGDKDKLELAKFYNNIFANTIEDILPDPFYFKPQIDAEVDTYYKTKLTLITGLAPNKLILIKCTNGEVDAGTPNIVNKKTKIDSASLTGIFSSQKLVKSNTEGEILIIIKAKSSPNFLTNKIVEIDINRIIGTFILQTKQAPIVSSYTPKKFKIESQLDVELNTECTSETIIVSGFYPNHTVSVVSYNGLIDCGTSKLSGTFETFRDVESDITGSIVLAVKGISSEHYGTYTEITINVNGYETTFDIRTKNNPLVISNNYFINKTNLNTKTKYLSNEITITNLPNVSMSVTYSLNDNSAISVKTDSEEKTIWNNNGIVTITPINHLIIIRVSLYSSNKFNTKTTLRLYLNGVLYDIFSLTTKNGPLPFSGPLD